ncbi:uncharacterized protein [Neodiprion pinetum]|uniref:uncharacterized protein n=1 Tax=Neodiprion pinetum TaxID=441929 RepID=UPI001EDD388C|nr:uncharacterized protein LOC124212550 [Neodiprion pinetum]
MYLDDYFVLNLTSFAGVFFTLIITCLTVIQKLKNRWPVKVNCWFCNNDSKICRQQRDWWLCPFCEQHNGFTENGDYNYDIPEQHKGLTKNSVRYCELSTQKESSKKSSLCSRCNRNEEIKMLHLANFEPSSNKKYDHELAVLKHKLEEKYKLCQKCSKVVEGVLSKQALWLLQYKMAFFKNKPIQHIINNARKWERVFRILLTILNSAMLFDATFWPLPIAGLLLQLGACITTPANKQHLDTLIAFFWIFIIILMPFSELKLLKIHLKNEYFTVEYITQFHVIMGLTVIIGLMNLRSSSFTVPVKSNVALKKLESPNSKKIQPECVGTTAARMTPFVEEKCTKNENVDIKQCRSPVNITNLLMTPVSVETPMPIKPTIFMQDSATFRHDSIGKTSSSKIYRTQQYSSTSNLNGSSIKSLDDKNSLNESLSTLSSLSLSNSDRKQLSKTPKIFQTKVYDSPSPDLFSKMNRSPNRKFFLSPPKLKSVTQTSWVAGGYWQAGMNAATLSRSSSQSSGFGSTGSNFVPSREPSIYNDLDRYSAVSDMTQCCHMSRHNSINSITSCCRQDSAFSFQRPDSPVFSQFPKIPQDTNLIRNSGPSQNFHTSNLFQNHPSVANGNHNNNNNNSNNHNHIQDVPMQTIHTTVLTSPVWLPALLCGSLIFNMVVLCTTLLR